MAKQRTRMGRLTRVPVAKRELGYTAPVSSTKAQPILEGAGQARSCSIRWTYQTLNPNKPKPQLCADCTGKVLFQQLDISNAASVIRFAAWAKREFPQGIDILVNNAGMAYKGDTFGAAEAQATLDINFYGMLLFLSAATPLSPNVSLFTAVGR